MLCEVVEEAQARACACAQARVRVCARARVLLLRAARARACVQNASLRPSVRAYVRARARAFRLCSACARRSCVRSVARVWARGRITTRVAAVPCLAKTLSRARLQTGTAECLFYGCEPVTPSSLVPHALDAPGTSCLQTPQDVNDLCGDFACHGGCVQRVMVLAPCVRVVCAWVRACGRWAGVGRQGGIVCCVHHTPPAVGCVSVPVRGESDSAPVMRTSVYCK